MFHSILIGFRKLHNNKNQISKFTSFSATICLVGIKLYFFSSSYVRDSEIKFIYLTAGFPRLKPIDLKGFFWFLVYLLSIWSLNVWWTHLRVTLIVFQCSIWNKVLKCTKCYTNRMIKQTLTDSISFASAIYSASLSPL